MKQIAVLLTFVGLALMATGCASDPNIEGARLDLRNDDYERALENVNTALESNPENAEAYQLKGEILQEQAGTVEDVEQHSQIIQDMMEAYERAIELDPSLEESISQQLRLAFYNEFQRGTQAFNRGREEQSEYGTAARYFQNAATIQPDSVDAYVNQGYALLNAGQQEEAIEPFETAIEMGTAEPDTYFFLANLYSTNDRADDAVALLEQAREQFPDNTDLQAELLNAYIRADQIDRAMEVYSEAVANEPDNELYRYNYGSLLLNAERYDEAIEQLERAVELDPEYGSAWYNLGASYVNKAYAVNEQVGEMDDALRAERANLNEQEIQSREAEIDAMVEERRGLYEQAIPPLERALNLMQTAGEDATRVCQALFGAYVQTGQQEKAEQLSECAGYEENN